MQELWGEEGGRLIIYDGLIICTLQYQGRIKLPKAARGHTTHIDGIVLNDKFRIQILCIGLWVVQINSYGRANCQFETVIGMYWN